VDEQFVLGNEAVALGAIDAGVTCAYGYPGTPSTEILEFLGEHYERHGRPKSEWCANEKTAYEAALGVSFAGKRTLVAMKHVGLNVAADPFMNSALVSVHGGLVVTVADDPGMHSSQNEQDSRYFADFARIPCLEPANSQEAYDMTREAFDLSERFEVPVMIRLVTRLAHTRDSVQTLPARDENPLAKAPNSAAWTLLPANSRRQWHDLLNTQYELRAYCESSRYNVLGISDDSNWGIVTTGVARGYFLENKDELDVEPSHLHIGAYPFPVVKLRKLASRVERLIIFEEGYPFLERYMRGLLDTPIEIFGKETGHVPLDGELDPDIVRGGLGLPHREGVELHDFTTADRPPKLCQGCPHKDSFSAMMLALSEFEPYMVTSDIGCYTLGALPPHSAIDTVVCMGASIGMGRGAAAAGYHPVVAVIGDSTFLHSGVTPLMDAVASKANMTVIILDNDSVAMTGGQPTILPATRLESILLGIGVEKDHLHVVEAHPRRSVENAEIIRKEVRHPGLSVVVAVRSCL
jgi:indolepyruvate ferredoxin oxidoreductase alpha subunit